MLAPLAALRDQGNAFWRVLARAAAQSMIVAPALQVIVVAVAGIELARQQITPGELVAAGQYAVLAVGIGASTGLVSQLGRARGGARRAAVLLAQPSQRYGAGSLAPGPGELRLRGVTVHGNGEAVLRDLDLTVPGGLAVAVVGRSGTGKSTLSPAPLAILDGGHLPPRPRRRGARGGRVRLPGRHAHRHRAPDHVGAARAARPGAGRHPGPGGRS